MNKTIVCLIKRMNKKAKYDKNIWTRLKKYSLLTFSISQVSMATDSTQIIPHCVFVVLVDIWTAVKRFKCVFVCVRFRSWRSRTSSLIRSSLLSCGASTPHARYTKLSDNNMHCKIWRFLIIQINCSIQFSSIVCEKLILLKAKKKKWIPEEMSQNWVLRNSKPGWQWQPVTCQSSMLVQIYMMLKLLVERIKERNQPPN